MSIKAVVTGSLREAIALAKEYVAANRALVALARNAFGEERLRLSDEIVIISAQWRRQIDKCNALRQMLEDCHDVIDEAPPQADVEPRLSQLVAQYNNLVATDEDTDDAGGGQPGSAPIQ